MKRDDVLLRRGSDPPESKVARVERRPLYVQEAGDAFFGWYHWSDAVAQRDCVAVICAPIGYEYTRAHRTLRHLADRLARLGVPALRFDYHGIGDSPGSDLDPARLAAWLSNVKSAICRARELSGRKRVCLVGVRLGATLAALVAAEIAVDWLALWNPCVAGKPYLRELRAIALAAQRVGDAVDGGLESGGFVMSRETQDEIAAIDLARAPIRAQRVLLLQRDDLTPEPGLAAHLASLGVACDEHAVPGWSGMMAEHQFTVVPDEALDTIGHWLVLQSDPLSGGALPPSSLDLADGATFDYRGDDEVRAAIEERCGAFGREGHLFGIVSRRAGPQAGGPRALPVVILLNAGAVHHVGPNRLYVELARRLAAAGYVCLRFDAESIGDSVRRMPGRENHPYPGNALTDLRAAIEYMRWEHGAHGFVVIGLCSGAHNAFHAGLELTSCGIEQVVLINPLTFYWSEGDSIETTTRLFDAIAYRKSMRDPGRWLKLLRGDVNFARIFTVIGEQARSRALSLWHAACERFAPSHAPPLARDLRRMLGEGRRIAVFVSDSDPADEILMAGASYTVTRAMRDGTLTIDVIADADHTFSQLAPRRELMRRLVAQLQRPL